MNPAEQRQRWIEDHGIDLWRAQAMAQFQGLLPEFARAVDGVNLRLLRAMERLCDQRLARNAI